jgi:hypothetical protein
MGSKTQKCEDEEREFYEVQKLKDLVKALGFLAKHFFYVEVSIWYFRSHILNRGLLTCCQCDLVTKQVRKQENSKTQPKRLRKKQK